MFVSARRIGKALEKKLGVVGLIGLFIAMIALSMGGTELYRQKTLLDAKRYQLDLLKQNSISNPLLFDIEQKNNQLQAYQQSFPGADQLSLIWPSIEQLARQEHIQLEQAAFQQAANNAAGFGRVEVSLPLKSPYLSLKRFLAAVLNQHKNVAIEALAMERTKPSDPVINVDLRLVLYYRLTKEGQ